MTPFCNDEFRSGYSALGVSSLLALEESASSHPIRTSVGTAVAVLIVLFWHYLFTHIPLWLNYVSHRIFQAAQDHPAVGRFVHVLINAVPDFSFALLAIAGLGYLVPGYIKELEKKRGVRIFLICFFTIFGLLAIVVNAVNREEQDHTTASQEERMGVVLKSVTNIQDALKPRTANMTEAERREHLASSLRDEYILSHNPIDPAILAGKAMPPPDWMNDRLNQMGEKWTVTREAPLMRSAPRSFSRLPAIRGSQGLARRKQRVVISCQDPRLPLISTIKTQDPTQWNWESKPMPRT